MGNEDQVITEEEGRRRQGDLNYDKVQGKRKIENEYENDKAKEEAEEDTAWHTSVQEDEKDLTPKDGPKLLTRPQSSDELVITTNSNIASIESNSEASPKTPSQTSAEREKEYAKARARIFDDSQNEKPKAASWATEALKTAAAQRSDSNNSESTFNASNVKVARGPTPEGSIGFTAPRAAAAAAVSAASNTKHGEENRNSTSQSDIILNNVRQQQQQQQEEEQKQNSVSSSLNSMQQTLNSTISNNTHLQRSNSGSGSLGRSSQHRGRKHHHYQQQQQGADRHGVNNHAQYQQYHQYAQHQQMGFYPAYSPRPPMAYYPYATDVYGYPIMYDQQHMGYPYPGLVYAPPLSPEHLIQPPRAGRPPQQQQQPAPQLSQHPQFTNNSATVPILPYPIVRPAAVSNQQQPSIVPPTQTGPSHRQQQRPQQSPQSELQQRQQQEQHQQVLINGTTTSPSNEQPASKTPTRATQNSPSSSGSRSGNRRGGRGNGRTSMSGRPGPERGARQQRQQQQQQAVQVRSYYLSCNFFTYPQQPNIPQRTYEEEFPSLGS
mmetsp:Transcript_6220/g.9279  ORF Transcript_6220/g.9279 Transcript_6220/m.9279 type:complete len:549 (+) Transcript_6220:146-1792(+)